MPSIWLHNKQLRKWCHKLKLGEVDGDFLFEPQYPISDPLVTSIAKYLNVDKSNICVGAGISQFIVAIISNPRWDKVILPNIEFGLYHRICKYTNKVVEDLDFDKLGDFVEKLKNIKSSKDSLLCFSSPMWFNGELFSIKDIQQIYYNFKGIIFIDEAYVDFSENPNHLLEFCLKNNRIILARSFSKKYLLSGVRAGYIISSENLDPIRSTFIPPHSIASHSIKLLINLINDDNLNKSFYETRKYICSNRNKIYEKLNKNQCFRIFNSQANFVTLLFNSKEHMETIYNKIFDLVGVNKYELNNKFFIKIWVKNLNFANILIEKILN